MDGQSGYVAVGIIKANDETKIIACQYFRSCRCGNGLPINNILVTGYPGSMVIWRTLFFLDTMICRLARRTAGSGDVVVYCNSVMLFMLKQLQGWIRKWPAGFKKNHYDRIGDVAHPLAGDTCQIFTKHN